MKKNPYPIDSKKYENFLEVNVSTFNQRNNKNMHKKHAENNSSFTARWLVQLQQNLQNTNLNFVSSTVGWEILERKHPGHQVLQVGLLENITFFMFRDTGELWMSLNRIRH